MDYDTAFPTSLCKGGRPRTDDRAILNAILYALITGCRWIDLPRKCDDDSTANRRLKNWGRLGVWKRVMDALVCDGYTKGTVKKEEL